MAVLPLQVDPAASLLLTDLYELNMYAAYLEAGMTARAVFEFFVRKLPQERDFLLATGLEQLLGFLEHAQFTEAELAWLEASGRFSGPMLTRLAEFRFTGEVYAVAEGTVVFADEPIVGIEAPLPEAQLLESRLINLVHFQTLIASKAARMVLAAPGRLLLDLDQAGVAGVRIFASGGLDEWSIARLEAAAPIDGYGIGTQLTTSGDAPALDAVYKLQAYMGLARRKRSEGKATWPGRKQVFRRRGPTGQLVGDILTTAGDSQPGEPLLRLVMHRGRRLRGAPSLEAVRANARAELASLPHSLQGLQPGDRNWVEIAPALRELSEEADRLIAAGEVGQGAAL